MIHLDFSFFHFEVNCPFNMFTHLFLFTVYKSDSPQYHSSSLLSQAMVIADGSSLGTLTSLAAVRQVTSSDVERLC